MMPLTYLHSLVELTFVRVVTDECAVLRGEMAGHGRQVTLQVYSTWRVEAEQQCILGSFDALGAELPKLVEVNKCLRSLIGLRIESVASAEVRIPDLKLEVQGHRISSFSTSYRGLAWKFSEGLMICSLTFSNGNPLVTYA